MKQFILPVSVVMGMGLSMVLTACGGLQQDPLAKYPLTSASRPIDNPDDLKKVIPEVRTEYVEKQVPVDRPVYFPTSTDQNYAAAQILQVTTNQAVSFIAGTETKIPFEVRMLQGNIEFTAAVSGLDGATLKEVAAEPNKKSYVLIYKPSVDAIPGSSVETSGSLRITVAVSSVKADSDEKQKRLQQAFDVISKSKSFDFTIRRNANTPKIVVAGFPASVNEGEKQDFSIKISAPGTYKGFQPEVYTTYDNKGLTGSLFENSGTPFIVPGEMENTGDGEWVKHYQIDTTLYALPAQLDKNMKKVENADSVLLRASFQVISPTRATSDPQTMQFKIVYKKVAAPAVAVPDSTVSAATPPASTTVPDTKVADVTATKSTAVPTPSKVTHSTAAHKPVKKK